MAGQLEALKAANISNWGNIVLVYEPLWALKLEKIASADQIQEACNFIRGWVRTNVGA
jgi:triosephosphate isomerase